MSLPAVVQEVLAAIPDYRLAPGAAPVRTFGNLRGVDRLEIEWDVVVISASVGHRPCSGGPMRFPNPQQRRGQQPRQPVRDLPHRLAPTHRPQLRHMLVRQLPHVLLPPPGCPRREMRLQRPPHHGMPGVRILIEQRRTHLVGAIQIPRRTAGRGVGAEQVATLSDHIHVLGAGDQIGVSARQIHRAPPAESRHGLVDVLGRSGGSKGSKSSACTVIPAPHSNY